MDLLEANDEAAAREMLHDLGCTDGLPVIVPTRARVDEMLAGAPVLVADDLIGVIPPRMGRATVTDVAASAVMAGCRRRSSRNWKRVFPSWEIFR